MSPPRPVWSYWAVFGLAVAASTFLVGWMFVRLERSFELRAITRDTLIDSLILTLGVLCLLVVAGWAVASRPRAPPKRIPDGYTYA